MRCFLLLHNIKGTLDHRSIIDDIYVLQTPQAIHGKSIIHVLNVVIIRASMHSRGFSKENSQPYSYLGISCNTTMCAWCCILSQTLVLGCIIRRNNEVWSPFVSTKLWLQFDRDWRQYYSGWSHMETLLRPLGRVAIETKNSLYSTWSTGLVCSLVVSYLLAWLWKLIYTPHHNATLGLRPGVVFRG